MRLIPFLLFLFMGAASGDELKLPEAQKLQLHAPADVLSWVPEESMSDSEKEAFEKAGLMQRSDSIADDGTYSITSSFESEEGIIRSSLWVVRQSDVAEERLYTIRRGAIEQAEASGGKVEAIACPPEWFDNCHLEVIRNSDGVAVGNMFFVRRAQSLYIVSFAGLGGFETAEDARAFLGEKAENALAFVPNKETVNSILTRRQQEKSAKESGELFVLLFLYVAVYVVLYWLTAAVNWVAKRELVGRRTVGLAGLSLCAFFLTGYILYAVSTSEGYAELDPYGQGLIQGEIIGKFLVPFIMVCIGVGVRRWFESRKRAAS